MNRTIVSTAILAAWMLGFSVAHAAEPDAGPYVGYLFAHMTKSDYGRLYYSISRDGLHWQPLNGGRRVMDERYRGHPDICRGHDGRFYLIGNHSRRPEMTIWVGPL